ncbi:MAG: hypothetical protein QGG50_08220 [Methanopyri archaeon]|jgi:hypothetical protein|nr:hypothetical protein [Methanopyri archaeon]
MYCETDGPLERVELNYVTEQTDCFNSSLLGGFKTHTVYDQRQEGFTEFMDGLATEMNDMFGASVDISSYEGHVLSANRALANAYRESDGIKVTLTGTKEAVKGFVTMVAERGYGLPQEEWFMADWHHPIQSVKGYCTSRNTREELADRFLLKETGDAERTITYVEREE